MKARALRLLALACLNAAVAVAMALPAAAQTPPADPARTAYVSMRTPESRFARYREACLQAVMARLRPRLPRDAGGGVVAGHVLLSLEIDADGRLVSLTLLRGAEDARLTGASLLAVREAAPFAPFPAVLRRDFDRFVLTLPLDFGA
ncbi:MAG: energy transducer TonB [Candidatus Dactylopiibacterium sp.]|nr:energy transducer TonB [Candidatus Dactylopiibacterium sp.]